MYVLGSRVKFAHEAGKASYCIIETQDGVVKGVAKLYYLDKQFCKDKGRKTALKKALEKTGYDKEERAVFWEAYRNMTKEPRW